MHFQLQFVDFYLQNHLVTGFFHLNQLIAPGRTAATFPTQACEAFILSMQRLTALTAFNLLQKNGVLCNPTYPQMDAALNI